MNESLVESRSTLFSKTMRVLAVMMGAGAVGAYLGAGITSSVTLIVLAVVWLLSTFAVAGAILAAKSDQSKLGLAVVLTGGWTLLSGLISGPALAMYVSVLGANTVFGAFLGSAAAMALFGSIGMLSGLNFSKLSSILGLALWGLIIVGLVGLFFSFSYMFDLVYTLAGLAVFSGYFVVDFWRVREAEAANENDWPTAMLLSVSLYLTFLNFLLRLLHLLMLLSKKND